MYSTAEFKKGLKIELDGVPYTIVEFQHVKPGKGGAFVRTKMKSLLTGRVLDQTFRSGEKVKRPDLMEREMQYLYREGDSYCMMDNETYEQIMLTEEQVGEARLYLIGEYGRSRSSFSTKQPVAVEVPLFVELAVTQTEPGVKGDTAAGGTKPATLESGVTIQVPLFINEGDRVKVDTRTGSLYRAGQVRRRLRPFLPGLRSASPRSRRPSIGCPGRCPPFCSIGAPCGLETQRPPCRAVIPGRQNPYSSFVPNPG